MTGREKSPGQRAVLCRLFDIPPPGTMTRNGQDYDSAPRSLWLRYSRSASQWVRREGNVIKKRSGQKRLLTPRVCSSHPAEAAVDLEFFANPAYQHTAFEVRSLADLRVLHQRVLGWGVPVKMALNHGVSLSFYFDDPEGYLIEVYWPTGVSCRPCHGDPINLTLSEEALRRHLAELGAGAGTPITADGAEPGRS